MFSCRVGFVDTLLDGCSCLPTSGADEFIQEDGSATYTHTLLINDSNATLTYAPAWDLRNGPAPEAGLSVDA